MSISKSPEGVEGETVEAIFHQEMPSPSPIEPQRQEICSRLVEVRPTCTR
jgi:hypothetical protein